MASVCRKRRPLASLLRRSVEIDAASSMSFSVLLTISSSMRVAWRALRAISDMPFLLLSSSSSVMIGRKTSCSSKRKTGSGSCISTLVSRTKNLGRLGGAARRAVLGVKIESYGLAAKSRERDGGAAGGGQGEIGYKLIGHLHLQGWCVDCGDKGCCGQPD
jgi:hypothetical protein